MDGCSFFREHEISLDAVRASACRPLIHHAVENERKWYQDAGLSALPPDRSAQISS